MKIKQIIKYEVNRLIHDKTRLVILLSVLCGIVIISLLISNFWIDDSKLDLIVARQYTQEYEEYLINRRDTSYEYYLIDSHQKEPTGPHAYGDPNEWLEDYKLFSFLLDNKLASYEIVDSDFIVNRILKIRFYQNTIFMFYPFIIMINIFYLFVYEKSVGYNKNFAIIGIEESKLKKGKFIFSICKLTILYLFLNLIGLVFYKNVTIMYFDGSNYHYCSLIWSSIQRSIEMYIALAVYYSMFYLFAKYINRPNIYFVLCIIISLLIFFCYGDIRIGLQGDGGESSLYKLIPMVNILVSNAFNDGNFLFRTMMNTSIIAFLLVIIKFKEIVKLKNNFKINRVN